MRAPRAGRLGARRARGAALLLAMIIVVLITGVSAAMVWHQDRAVQIEAAERARTQAAWILSGALDWARLILQEDARGRGSGPQAYDGLDEPWATPLAEARLSSFLAADADNTLDSGPEAFISGQISDAQARWNLRTLLGPDGKLLPAGLAALDRLCSLAAVPGETAARLGQVMVQAYGKAEEGDPPDPETVPLQPQRLDDLRWFGLPAETLQRLAPYVDLLPVPTPVNVNTAPREAIVAAIDGIGLGTAERLVLARQRRSFRSLDELREHLAPDTVLEPSRVAVGSTHFEVAGRLRLEERVLEERSLLVRRGTRVEVLRRERHSFQLDAAP